MKINLVEVAESLFLKLRQRGVCFTQDGFPIFKRDMILDAVPNDIIPYKYIKSTTDKDVKAICFFQEDELLYPRLTSLEKDIPLFREYLGVCGLDLSPNLFWPIEQQLFNILLSQLYTAYLAVNRIKIIPNWRIGDLRTLKILDSYPRGSQFVVGTLGSVRNNKSSGIYYVRAKALASSPSRLLIYGKLESEYRQELIELGIPHIQYDDIMSKRNAEIRRRKYDGC